MNKRQERINNFKEFFDNSESIFDDISKNDKNHKRLEKLFSFYVSPGGRILQYDDKLVEVFYGKRPIGIKKSLEDNLQIKEKAEIATGATLQYSRTDDGRVVCYLYPAKSENQRPIEDFFIIDYIKDPSKIKSRVKFHWKLFVSYMESTCIDGDLDLIQKIRLFYLKNFKQYVVNGVVQDKKAKLYFSDLSKYILTIGLSGFMILFITYYKDSIENKEAKMADEKILGEMSRIRSESLLITNHLNKLNNNIEKIIDNSKDNSGNLEDINSRLKSINNSINNIEKAYNKSLNQIGVKNAPPG